MPQATCQKIFAIQICNTKSLSGQLQQEAPDVLLGYETRVLLIHLTIRIYPSWNIILRPWLTFAACLAFCILRQAKMTLQPYFAICAAVAKPIPAFPPVTMQVCIEDKKLVVHFKWSRILRSEPLWMNCHQDIGVQVCRALSACLTVVALKVRLSR